MILKFFQQRYNEIIFILFTVNFVLNTVNPVSGFPYGKKYENRKSSLQGLQFYFCTNKLIYSAKYLINIYMC